MSTGKSKVGGGSGLKIPAGNINRSKVASSVSQSRLFKDKNVTIGLGSRTTLNSSTRKSQTGIDSKLDSKTGLKVQTAVQVFDEAGSDVTPQPLFTADPTTVKQNQSKLFTTAESSTGTPTDLMSQASIYQTGVTSFAAPFTRSLFGTTLSHQSSRSSRDSFAEEITEPTAGVSNIVSGLGDVQRKYEEVQEELSEADLEKEIEITLCESDVIWLLDIPGTCVSQETDDAADIRSKNEKYAELCKARDGNDRYAERGMQTFNDAPKNKDVQTSKVEHMDAGSMATTWDLYDTYNELNKEKSSSSEEIREDEDGDTFDVTADDVTGSNGKKESVGSKNGGSENKSSVLSSSVGALDSIDEQEQDQTSQKLSKQNEEAILQSEELKRDLFVMERVVTLNIYQAKQAAYRELDALPDIDVVKEEPTEEQKNTPVDIAQLGPNLDRLWAYSCLLTKGRNVSCMAWNRLNPDLLAVGYGQFGFKEQKGGIVCCWSLKNPEYPERVFQCEAGVTAIDYSITNPNLLAVGMYNGSVAIYNVRASSNEPILDSYESRGKHGAPVWQLQWIDKEKGSGGEEKGEILVSISTDGRVTQWQIRKGFECVDLMKLKKLAKASKKKDKETKEGQKGEAFISRQASGLCFDFHSKDPNIYLAGTEDGHVHKCSCSYNEQYLDSYTGHTGPVYKLRWSPFLPDVFLSCSADWSIRLWIQNRLKPVFNFFSSTKSVMDVCWSPTSATVFGCVNEGAVEIWDLAVNTLDPIIVSVPAPGVKLACLLFASNSNCLLVGDSEGQVSVYQLRNMPDVKNNQVDVLSDLIQQNVASQRGTHLK
ncbi:WD repeat-containing protein 78 [Holothuria leucospilota]|uniref:Dynein axonemal intermediate chain 4 n=1 Tax=Holothuria leucospilota TaxID=206669 RepID=A0A9Q1C9G4_HOLLE|nr:WD repeat-containing protein 78 [Holothuria leucospilota]